MEIYYIGNEKWYNNLVWEEIQETVGKTNRISFLESHRFKSDFKAIVENILFSLNRTTACLIVDTEHEDVIDFALQTLKRTPLAVPYIRIIAISTLLTWADKRYPSEITNADYEFQRRVPNAAAYSTYTLENALFSFTKKNNAHISVLGLGLVYGGAGYDLKDVFKNIWTASPTLQLLSPHTQNTVPMTHYKNIATQLIAMLESYNFNNNDNSSDVKSDFYIPCVDSSTESIQSILEQINNQVNPSSAGSGEASSYLLPPLHPSLLIEKVLEDERASFWACDLPFRGPFTSTLLNTFSSTWSEYLLSNNLRAVTIVVSGPPRVGKTEAAKEVAQRLSLQYIDLLCAARYAFNLTPTQITTQLDNRVFDVEVIGSVREEIESVLEQKASEGKKGKPDKNAPTESVKYDESHLTETFCAGLPTELSRKVLALYLLTSTKSIRYGYVLDIWTGTDNLLGGYKNLVDMICSVLRQPVAMVATTEGEASMQDEISNEVEETKESVARRLLGERLELLVELQSPDSTLIERLLTSQGAAVKAKESVAAVKALEASLQSYRANVVTITTTESLSSVSVGSGQSHKGVVEIAEELSSALSVLRLDVTSPSPLTTSQISQAVVDHALSLHNGVIGWIDAPSDPNTVDETSNTSDVTTQGNAPPNDIDLIITSPGVSRPATGAQTPKTSRSSGGRSKFTSPEDGKEDSLTFDGYDRLSDEQKVNLADKSRKAQHFLSSTILPHIATAMIQIHRDRPEDPIGFLAQYLLTQSVNLCEEERRNAHELFSTVLRGDGVSEGVSGAASGIQSPVEKEGVSDVVKSAVIVGGGSDVGMV